MSEDRHFSPGDRVRTIRGVGGIALGTRGTVAYSFLLAPLYQVCFDGNEIPHLVAHDKLAPDGPERASTHDAS